MRQWVILIATVSVLSSGAQSALAFRGRVGTPASLEMHGMAHIIRNQGRAIRAVSQANINNEEARSKFIDNRRKWTATYFANKELIDANKAKESAKKRASRENFLRSNPSGAPARLTLSQFDPATGEIMWPAGLQLTEFDKSRMKVESLFAVRSRSAATTTLATDIRSVVDSMRTALKSQIKSMAPNEYMAARKFLDSLSFEASQTQR